MNANLAIEWLSSMQVCDFYLHQRIISAARNVVQVLGGHNITLIYDH